MAHAHAHTCFGTCTSARVCDLPFSPVPQSNSALTHKEAFKEAARNWGLSDANPQKRARLPSDGPVVDGEEKPGLGVGDVEGEEGEEGEEGAGGADGELSTDRTEQITPKGKNSNDEAGGEDAPGDDTLAEETTNSPMHSTTKAVSEPVAPSDVELGNGEKGEARRGGDEVGQESLGEQGLGDGDHDDQSVMGLATEVGLAEAGAEVGMGGEEAVPFGFADGQPIREPSH